jgi:hypothetical protein
MMFIPSFVRDKQKQDVLLNGINNRLINLAPIGDGLQREVRHYRDANSEAGNGSCQLE